jgi:OmpA-OmpF porin, OOP family
MYKFLLPLCCLLNVITLAQAADTAQPEQLQQIESLQRIAGKLTYADLDINNYHLAKARTWLELALSEAYDKDSTGIVSASIGQAKNLLEALQKNQAGISMDTPMELPGSETVRPDLWNKIAALKQRDKFSCGQQSIAQAEAYLVWTGHEKAESGWSHAESYLRSVEDLIYEGQVAIDNCTSAPVIALPPPPLEKITLSTDVLFAFDKATLQPNASSRLDELAQSIKQSADTLEMVLLVGHTDRLRSDGRLERNAMLSVQRAESIKQYLIGKGIPANKIRATGVGSELPIVQCPTKTSKEKQVACLQPNRRVEITLSRKKTAAAGKEQLK